MKFTKVYEKYRLYEKESCKSKLRPKKNIIHKYFTIMQNGDITGYKDYMWDGPSGPSIDTDNSLVPSCFHDVIYQAMRLGLLDRTDENRLIADKLFYKQLRDRGMFILRAKLWYGTIRIASKKYTYPQQIKVYEVD